MPSFSVASRMASSVTRSSSPVTVCRRKHRILGVDSWGAQYCSLALHVIARIRAINVVVGRAIVYTNTKHILTKVDTGYLFLLSTMDREKSICQAIRAIKSKCAYLVFSCTAKEVCVLCCSKTRHCKDHRAAQYRHFPHWHRPPTFFSASTPLLRKSGGSKSYPRGCAGGRMRRRGTPMQRQAPCSWYAPRIEQPQHLVSIAHHANPANARRRHDRLLRAR